MKDVPIAPIPFFFCRRMKTIALGLAILCASAATIPAQETGSGSSVAGKVRELELARLDAQRRKDNRTLDAMLDNALVWVEPNGVQLTKADYLANLRSSEGDILEIAPAPMTVHVFGDIAIVAGIYREKGVKGGRLYLQRVRFIDTWTFKDGKWVCIAAAATSSIS